MSAPQVAPAIGTSVVARIKGLITEPSATLKSILEQPSGIILALLILMVPTLLAQYLYWQGVDFNFVTGTMAQALPAAEAEQMLVGLEQMGATGMMITSLVSVLIAVPVMMAISAGYLLLVNRVAGTEQRSFKTWFAVVTYSSIFGAITGLSAIAHVLLDSSGQIMPEMLAVTNLNALITQFPYGHDLYKFMASVDLASLVAIALMAIALVQNGHRTASAVIIAALPSAIIWTIALL